jgi:hypothetical protein
MVSQGFFDTQVGFIQNAQGLAHLQYKLFGRQLNKRIWQTLPVRTQNLANLADMNSKKTTLPMRTSAIECWGS